MKNVPLTVDELEELESEEGVPVYDKYMNEWKIFSFVDRKNGAIFMDQGLSATGIEEYEEEPCFYLKNPDKEDRGETLLRACLDLLKKQEESAVILNLLETIVFYDEAECDGRCLMEDIENYLEVGN